MCVCMWVSYRCMFCAVKREMYKVLSNVGKVGVECLTRVWFTKYSFYEILFLLSKKVARKHQKVCIVNWKVEKLLRKTFPINFLFQIRLCVNPSTHSCGKTISALSFTRKTFECNAFNALKFKWRVFSLTLIDFNPFCPNHGFSI